MEIETIEMQTMPDLNEREDSILRLMCDNCSSQEIANRLFLSKRTIDFYRARLMIRFDAKNSATLVKRAIDSGLL